MTTDEVRDNRTTENVIYPSDTYDEQVAEARAAFDAWLSAHDAQVAARAWDEGFEASVQPHSAPMPRNPYYLPEGSTPWLR